MRCTSCILRNPPPNRAHARANVQAGVTIIEFALVLPVFFLIIFGFFDVARYWQAKAALQKAGSEGVNMFAINRDIKRKGSTATPDIAAYNQAYTAISDRVRDRAAVLALAAGGNANNVRVTPELPPTANDFKKQPIAVTVGAQFRGTFLPIDVEVTATVTGYAETFRTSAQPIITDCGGRLFDATDPPGGGGYGLMCPCENGDLSFQALSGDCICSSSYYAFLPNGTSLQPQDDGSQACGCPNGLTPVLMVDYTDYLGASVSVEQLQGYNNSATMCCPAGSPMKCPGNQYRPFVNGTFSCTCTCGGTGTVANPDGSCSCSSPDKTFNASYSTCVCKPDLAACPSGAYRDPNSCECKCFGDGILVGNECTCANTNKTYNGSACVCPAGGVTCDAPMMADNSNAVCACVCPAGSTSNGYGGCTCPPTSSGSPRHLEGNSCVCDATPSSCSDSRMIFNATSCGCGCPGGSTVNPSGVCVCNSAGQVFNASNQCVCDPAVVCPDPKMTKNTTTCACVCPSGSSNASNVCTCPSGKVFNAGGTACVCDPSVACSDPRMTKDANCACKCPSGSTNVSGVCTCSAGKIFNGANQCVCDSSVACPDPRMTKNASCACQCPSGSTNVSGVCTCPSGKVFNGSNQCVCAAGACPDPRMTRNPTTCACSCPAGSTFNGTECVCSPGAQGPRHFEGNACVCDLSASACPDSSMSVSSECGCACPYGLQDSGGVCCPAGSSNVGGSCVCSGGKVLSNDGSSCVCPSCANGYVQSNDGTCSCSCTTGNVVNSGGTDYCAPFNCFQGCSFDSDGTCSDCPSG